MPTRRVLVLGLLALPAACTNPTLPRSDRSPAAPRTADPPLRRLNAPYEVATDANLRSGPGTSYRILAGVKAGSMVQAIGKVDGTGWLKVRAGGREGFIHQDLLRPAKQGSGEDELPAPQEEPGP